MYDFDTVIDRCGTGSTKWSKYDDDVIPMWIADMDFSAPPELLAAVQTRLEHGVLGYSIAHPELTETIVDMLATAYDWKVEPNWLLWLPGVVTGLNLCCRLLEADDAVMTLTPIYPPFLTAPHFNDRKVHRVRVERQGDGWPLPITTMAEACNDHTRMFFFCNPHNPIGKVYSEAEVQAVGEFCVDHDLLVCSDEIHCDLLLDDVAHHPLAALDNRFAERSITFMAPSKTYNVPGMGTAFAIIPDDRLRRQFRRTMRGIVPDITALGFASCQAAYAHGGPWLSALLDYLRTNRDLVQQAVADMPGLKMAHVQATYLAWIDARESGFDRPCAAFEKAGVGLSNGADFGEPGFVRLNFGCPRSVLREALRRMATAY